VVLMSGEGLGGAAWCGCPESPPYVRRALGGTALPPRRRRVAAAGRGCIAVSRRGVAGEGRTFLLRRNVLCSKNIIENKFYFILSFLKSVRAQGGREIGRERGREPEQRNIGRVPLGRGETRRSRGVAREGDVGYKASTRGVMAECVF
jgi:hypothetical protein